MVNGLSPNMEHYIQTIYLLQRKYKVARVKEIAEFMGVTMPSVTSAVKSLREKKMVDNTRYGYVELTEDGQDVAVQLIERHKMLRKFLADVLQLDESIADVDACKIEHVISEEVMDRLNKFIHLVNLCPKLIREWNQIIAEQDDHVFTRNVLCNNCNEVCN